MPHYWGLLALVGLAILMMVVNTCRKRFKKHDWNESSTEYPRHWS